jgi:hypothetical protein
LTVVKPQWICHDAALLCLMPRATNKEHCMATLTFLGAAQQVTGSCYLLQAPGLGRVLLDCGLHQGNDARGENDLGARLSFGPKTICSSRRASAARSTARRPPRACWK